MVQQVTYAAQDKQVEAPKEIKKYYITLHPGTFPTKESFELGKITNWFKKKGRPQQFAVDEIFELCTQGKCFIPSNIELDEEGKSYRFISSRLIFVDVDDDNMVTEPQEVLDQLSEVCAGLFFTSSHGIKGNRYRLVFVLDSFITNEKEYKEIFEVLAEQLEAIGLPVDKGVNSPLQRMRTAMNGYIISNLEAVYPVAKARKLVERKREERKAFEVQSFKRTLDKDYRIYSFEELKARAEVIGYVNDYTSWQNLAYSLKSYVYEGHINDIEGYEVFSILCGGNDETVYWQNLKPSRITIGTFIDASNKVGFKGDFKYYHAFGDAASNLEVKRVKFEKYMPIDYTKSLLVEEKNILVKSPTGSGKTTSFISAAKELCEELRQQDRTRFFIFAVPTIAICDQVANDHDILAIRGNDVQVKKKPEVEKKSFEFPFILNYDEANIEKPLYLKLSDYFYEGNRVIVCTYDMAEAVYKMLDDIKPFSSFGLIVDEYHQFTAAYKYRHKAIESLNSLVDSMKSFIALSGTPDDILRDPFDYEVHVSTKYENAPCQMWGAITYNKEKDEEPMLFELIKRKAQNGTKLLVFIQFKEMIKRLKLLLDSVGINTAAVSSDGKKENPTYLTLVNESRFPAEVDVILTTSVLSDGININNENNNYECILVASQKKSPLFDIAQVRQCANRFRNTYRSFMIYMLEARESSQRFYNIESAYNYEKRLATNAIEILNSEFKDTNSYKLMSMGVLENRYGIDLDDKYVAYYNPLKLRYNVAEEKKRFYTLYRNEFLTALNKLMGANAAEPINITEALEAEGVDLSEIAEEIEELKEAAKLSNQMKRERIGLHFTKRIHEAFKVDNDENEEILKVFKQAVTIDHFFCLKGIAKFTDYHTCLKIVKNLSRPCDKNKFKKRIEAFVNICHYKAIERKEPTRTVYFALAEHLNKEFHSKIEFDEMWNKVGSKTRLAKKVSVDEIVKNYFDIEKTKHKKSRGFILRELTIDTLSQEFELDRENVVQTIKNYADMKGESVTKIIVEKAL